MSEIPWKKGIEPQPAATAARKREDIGGRSCYRSRDLQSHNQRPTTVLKESLSLLCLTVNI